MAGVNLSALAPATTAIGALSNLVLVSPQATVGYQPQNPGDPNGPALSPQPKAFMFDYEGEQSVSLESDITDHYVEDNTAVQDQIALKPETITVRGYVGELNDIAPGVLAVVQSAAEKLTAIGSYVPQLSATALIAYQEAFFLYQTAAAVANAAIAAVDGLANITSGGNGQAVVGSTGLKSATSSQNNQQAMFQKLYGYWRARTLFTVQTPWAVFQNMAIKSIKAIQDPDTDKISDFEVSFKMIRVASSTSSGGFSNLPAYLQGRFATQASDTQDLGTATPSEGPSLTDGLSGMGA